MLYYILITRFIFNDASVRSISIFNNGLRMFDWMSEKKDKQLLWACVVGDKGNVVTLSTLM